MQTNELIQQLAGHAAPVRRLLNPWQRTAIWFAIALPYVALITVTHASMPELAPMLADWKFVVEQTATLLTAMAAAMAAFCSVIPGYDRRILALPLLPLAVWMATVGNGCVRDWLQFGAKGLELRADWDCLPPAALIGIVPAIVFVAMLRRGAPLLPRTSIALAALATAALGNFGLRLFHFGDASIMILVWHLGAVALFSILAGWSGSLILRWRSIGVETTP